MESEYFAYILQSDSSGRFYVGHCKDLAVRLDYHNSGRVTSTRNKSPRQLAWSERFGSRSAAYGREREIKKWKSAVKIRELVGSRAS